ncbi:Flp1 family type IVb pilin [Sporosalibacterium faouarense]|uniref:Flp1 family type IVb pilin n=1 Tax=Sporosalibacterium faouarense TaxID=516123 RepID=UPI00141CCCCB|nr:Flp1 family type IVb pilin [Sporosalibacterium faouarense]MTI47478.1 hypothetical protein [Bacillota bacterium]
MLNLFKRFLKEEDGLGIVEVVLILAIMVGIALIFREKITEFVGKILASILGNEDSLDSNSTKDMIDESIENNMNN